MHHLANLYLVGYAVAGICVFLAAATFLGGEVVGRRGRHIITRANDPGLFWSNIVLLLAIAAICGGLVYWHQIAREQDRNDRYDAAQFQQ